MNFKIEADSDAQLYQLVWGAEDDQDYAEGDRVSFGERAFCEREGELYFAFIDSDGQTDGKVYKVSDGIDVTVDTDWDFSE